MASKKRSQPAMEYLMTYGWALLIIAVVFVSLFSLGFFNAFTFVSHLQPGSCYINRPNGPGTTSFINSEGSCSGIPSYVMQTSGTGDIKATSEFYPTTPGDTQVTVSFWMYWDGTQSQESPFSFTDGYGLLLVPTFSGACLGFTTGYGDVYGYESPPSNSWIFVTAVFDNSNPTNSLLYINSVWQSLSQCANMPAAVQVNDQFQIGGGVMVNQVLQNGYFTGRLANVQIYNTSLVGTGSDIRGLQSLYKEGIGGVPMDLVQLAGWWPLNGNEKDYSGNGNGGIPTNVVYLGGWTNGYNAP